MDTLTKEEVVAIIDSVPLGYRTECEHLVLERFAERLIAAIRKAETGKVKIPRD